MRQEQQEPIVVHENPWFRVVSVHARNRDWFQILGPDSCIVIGTLQRRVVLVSGSRVSGGGARVIELPGGMCEPEEEPAQTARREFSEETGLRLAQVELVASFLQSPALSPSRCHVFTGEVLDGPVEHTICDSGEDWQPVVLDQQEIATAIAHGSVVDGPTLAALRLFDAFQSFSHR